MIWQLWRPACLRICVKLCHCIEWGLPFHHVKFQFGTTRGIVHYYANLLSPVATVLWALRAKNNKASFWLNGSVNKLSLFGWVKSKQTKFWANLSVLFNFYITSFFLVDLLQSTYCDLKSSLNQLFGIYKNGFKGISSMTA